METYTTERLADTFLRINVNSYSDFRTWSIAINQDPKNTYVETMFLPDHTGPTNQRVKKHGNIDSALKFMGLKELPSDITREILKA